MPKFPKNINFSLQSPLSKIESKANTLTNAQKAAQPKSGTKKYSSSFKRTNKKEYISDYEFKTGKKPPTGTRMNAMVHEVNKKTTNNPVKTDPSGNYMTPNTNFKTKPTLADGVTKDTRKTTKSKPIDFKNDKAPKTNYKTKFVDDSKSKVKTKVKTNKKKKVTFKEAYKNRDMKTYGNLSFDEYKTEAKRQTKSKKTTKSYDAPKSQMEGTVTGPKTKPKTTKTKETTLKPDPKNFETVKSAKAKRKSAKKAVRTARKEFGRGSAEVKAAKTKRKEAKANVRSTKKRDKAASGKRSTIGKIGYFLAGPAGRAKMDAKKSAKKSTKTTKTAKKDEKVDLTKKSGKGPLAKTSPMYNKPKYTKANPHPMAGSKNAKGTKVVDVQGNWKRINPVAPKK